MGAEEAEAARREDKVELKAREGGTESLVEAMDLEGGAP